MRRCMCVPAGPRWLSLCKERIVQAFWRTPNKAHVTIVVGFDHVAMIHVKVFEDTSWSHFEASGDVDNKGTPAPTFGNNLVGSLRQNLDSRSFQAAACSMDTDHSVKTSKDPHGDDAATCVRMTEPDFELGVFALSFPVFFDTELIIVIFRFGSFFLFPGYSRGTFQAHVFVKQSHLRVGLMSRHKIVFLKVALPFGTTRKIGLSQWWLEKRLLQRCLGCST